MNRYLLFLIVLLLLTHSIFSSDYARGYSFLEMAVDSDLIALVTVLSVFQHGYLCKIEDVIYSKQVIDSTKIMIWAENNFEFGKINLQAKRREMYLVALTYNKIDQNYENDYIFLIEKAGTYYLSEAGQTYVEYKKGVVFGCLIEPFGWVEQENGELEFIPYKKTQMNYNKFKKILIKKLSSKK